ncbi:RidA family protein [uncultured Sulfitobacter sp.]|jgi:enamine deaminase RidA (YjgF/YER057c/UK114 family)|uniref:RidA family protein n=1 Tax=uncultured Sulfitobacter sp. TaxID=191468 RepID=UPI001617A9A0|tara:strand:+ start:151 stop:558 length:408 start_codon:yes stop_codon:yes gene_type:complete
MQTSLQRMNPAALPNTSNLGYSQISIANAGILAFVSGQVAQAADGSAVPEGLEAQTKQVIANLTEALKALEASPQNIVQMRIYVTDLNEDAMNILMPPIIAFLNGAEPSLTGIGVAALAGPDLKVEIEMIVQLPT